MFMLIFMCFFFFSLSLNIFFSFFGPINRYEMSMRELEFLLTADSNPVCVCVYDDVCACVHSARYFHVYTLLSFYNNKRHFIHYDWRFGVPFFIYLHTRISFAVALPSFSAKMHKRTGRDKHGKKYSARILNIIYIFFFLSFLPASI